METEKHTGLSKAQNNFITLKLPMSSSLSGRALALLLTGHRITHRHFQNHTSSYRLSASIFELRQDGWPIDDKWHCGLTNDSAGRHAKYKSYFILDEEISRLFSLDDDRLKSYLDAVEKYEGRRK
jgi:hypothetical protein